MDSQTTTHHKDVQPTVYDLTIIGGGPAGCAAAVYAARKQLKTLLIVKEWGGQSVVSDDIQNWIGTPHISGRALGDALRNHVEEYKGDFLTLKEDEVNQISGEERGFIIGGAKEFYYTKTILVATGSSRRRLEVPGADTLEHKGLTYCASCDGPLFSDGDVVVVGGGNAGFESAAQLLAYCKSVTLLSRSAPRADEITIDKLRRNPKFTLIENAVPTKIEGGAFVESITFSQGGVETKMPVAGVFVEIGQIPATSFLKGFVELNETGNVVINPRTQETSMKGIWAAGDCTDVLYHQNNIAAGDAVRALEDIYLHLHA